MTAAKRRTRKTRRLNAARLRSGHRIVRHALQSGRTGKVHSTRMKSKKGRTDADRS
jgi:hypothetical protein